MITKISNFRGLNLSLDELIELAQNFEKAKDHNGDEGRLHFVLDLGQGEIYDVDNSEELRSVLAHELRRLKEIDFFFYSNALEIKLDTSYESGGYVLRISAPNKERILVLQESFKTILSKRKNANWIVRGPMSYVVLTAVFSVALVPIAIFLFDREVRREHTISIVGSIVWASVSASYFVGRLIKTKYPLLLISDGSDANGRSVKTDWYAFVGAIILPFLIEFTVAHIV